VKRSETLLALRIRDRSSLILAFGLLALWELASRTVLRGSLYFPSPREVFAGGLELLRNGELARHWSATVGRLLAGFALGAPPAVLVGVWLGLSKSSRRAVDPLLAAAHAVPKIAAYPLFLIAFGLGETSRISVIAASMFFPLALNTTAGVRQVSPVYLDVAKNYGASTLRTLGSVVLPASLPMILTGARIAMTLSLLLTIAVEIIGARSGLGYLVWMSWETFHVADLYVALIASAATGIGVRLLFDGAASRLIPWRTDENR
jgi:ABC-type nitrate/sulfonate/bicarbonate transport system permease component